MSDMLPPTVQFLASPDTPGPESPGRPLVAKIPGSHPPPGSSATLETITQSLFGHSPPPSLTYAAPGGPSSSGTQPLQSRSLLLVPSHQGVRQNAVAMRLGLVVAVPFAGPVDLITGFVASYAP